MSELGEIKAAVTRVEGQVETVDAKLQALLDRTDDERKALFAYVRDHERAIADIKADYVPRDVLNQHVAENREEHAEFTKQIAGLNTRAALISSGVSLLAFLLGTAAQVLGGWLK